MQSRKKEREGRKEGRKEGREGEREGGREEGKEGRKEENKFFKKAILEKPIVDIILNGERLKLFPLRSGTRQGGLL